MTEFTTKQELETSYIKWIVTQGVEKSIGEILVKSKTVYAPHLYRGGYVIPGYGYSVERIGKYVQQQIAGNPYLVEGN